MFREGLRPPDPFGARDAFRAAKTQDGMSLRALFEFGTVLVVCLPTLDGRAGRKMLEQLAAQRRGIERSGVRILLVHMEGNDAARASLDRHDLWYVARVADPQREIYAALGLTRSRRLWGGPRQLPGVFVFEQGEVAREFRPESERGRPDYQVLLSG